MSSRRQRSYFRNLEWSLNTAGSLPFSFPNEGDFPEQSHGPLGRDDDKLIALCWLSWRWCPEHYFVTPQQFIMVKSSTNGFSSWCWTGIHLEEPEKIGIICAWAGFWHLLHSLSHTWSDRNLNSSSPGLSNILSSFICDCIYTETLRNVKQALWWIQCWCCSETSQVRLG